MCLICTTAVTQTLVELKRNFGEMRAKILKDHGEDHLKLVEDLIKSRERCERYQDYKTITEYTDLSARSYCVPATWMWLSGSVDPLPRPTFNYVERLPPIVWIEEGAYKNPDPRSWRIDWESKAVAAYDQSGRLRFGGYMIRRPPTHFKVYLDGQGLSQDLYKYNYLTHWIFFEDAVPKYKCIVVLVAQDCDVVAADFPVGKVNITIQIREDMRNQTLSQAVSIRRLS